MTSPKFFRHMAFSVFAAHQFPAMPLQALCRTQSGVI